MPVGIFSGFADIHDHRFFAVDQLYRAIGGERAGAASTQGGPQQHATRRQGDGDQHPVIEKKLHLLILRFRGMGQSCILDC
jgi:hypothetical protein